MAVVAEGGPIVALARCVVDTFLLPPIGAAVAQVVVEEILQDMRERRQDAVDAA